MPRKKGITNTKSTAKSIKTEDSQASRSRSKSTKLRKSSPVSKKSMKREQTKSIPESPVHRKRGRPRKNPEVESEVDVRSKSKKGASSRSIPRSKVKTEVKVETKSTARGRKPSLKVKDEYKEVNKKSAKGPRTKPNIAKKEEYESDARSYRSKSKITKAVKVEAKPRGRPPKDKNLAKKAISRPTKGSVTKRAVKVKVEPPKPRMKVKKEVVRKLPARKPPQRRVKVEVKEFSSDDDEEEDEFEGESESEEQEEEESPERMLRTPKEVGRRKKESNITKRSPVRQVKEEPKRISTRLGYKDEEEGLSKIQQKVIKKGRMKREDLPVFPTKSMYVEDLILDAINYLKAKASEDNVLEYLEKRFCDINQDLVAGVMDRLIFEERISLKRGHRKSDKRPLQNCPDLDYLRSSPKRQKTEREPVIPIKKELVPPKKRRLPPPIKKEETIYETDPEDDDEKLAKIEEDSESDIQFIEVIEISDLDVKNEEERYEKPQPVPQKSVVFRDEPRMVPPKRKEEKKVHHHHHHNSWTSRPYQNQNQHQAQPQPVKSFPRKEFREEEKINTIVNRMAEETVTKVEGNRTPERARGEQIEEEESEKDEKETQEATVKVSESNSKKALIEYYEKKLLGNSNYKNNLESQKKKDIAGKSEKDTAQTNEEITKKEEPEAAGAGTGTGKSYQQPQRVVSDFVAEALAEKKNKENQQQPEVNKEKKPEVVNKEKEVEKENEAKVEDDGQRRVACDQTIVDENSHSHSHSEHEGGERKEGRLQEIMRMLSETGPINQTNEEEVVQKVEEEGGRVPPPVEQGIETENLVINSQAFGTQMSQQSSVQICYSQSLLTESTTPLVIPDSQITAQGEPIVKLSTSQMLQEEVEKEPKISISQMEESAQKKPTVLSNSPILKGINHEPASEAKVSESQLDIKISASQIIEIEDDPIVPHPQNIILQQNNEEDLTTPAPTYTVFTRLVPLANTNDEEEAAFRRDPAEDLVSPKFGGGSIQKNGNENQVDKNREEELELLKKNLSKVIVQNEQDKENQKPTEEGDVITKTEEEEEKCKEEEEPRKENVQKVKEKMRTAVGEYLNLVDGKAGSEQRTGEGSQKDPLIILEKEKNSGDDENYVKEEEGSGKFSVSKYFN